MQSEVISCDNRFHVLSDIASSNNLSYDNCEEYGDTSSNSSNSNLIKCNIDNINESVCSVPECDGDTKCLDSFYANNQLNLKIAHLNINSIRHKFHPLSQILSRSLLDILFIQETKIDASFPCGQFHVDKYITYRKDVKCDSGGIMAIVRSDLPQTRRFDLEHVEVNYGRVEIMVIELMIRKNKWYLCSLYKQPTVKDGEFKNIVLTP